MKKLTLFCALAVVALPVLSVAAAGQCPATFTNPGFNSPFPSGVAEGWSTRTLDGGITFRQFTGSQYEGNSAQAVEARDGWTQKSIVYQTGNVCPGTEYRITVKAGFIPRGAGTHWDSYLGVAQGTTNNFDDASDQDPLWNYGEGSIAGTGQVTIVALQNQLTILLFTEIAWGDAWFDNVVIEEIGTATIPPTNTPTVTPTPRIVDTPTPTPTRPAELGPNLTANSDFELAFDSGQAEAWTGFATRGEGYRKENAKLGRVGGGIYGFNAANDNDTRNFQMMGKSYLVSLDRFDMITQLRNQLGDDVITVAKWDAEAVFDGGNPTANPEANGRYFAEWWNNRSRTDGHWGHVYYGLNEPSMNVIEDLRKVGRFELAFTRRCHELGMRSVVINNSFGTPDNLNNMLIPEIADLFEEADYVGYHPYADPRYNQSCDPRGYDIVLRYVPIRELYEERNWRIPPVIYTEGGDHSFDDTSFPYPEDVRDDMVCFEGLMRQYPWTIGLNYFVTASWPGSWSGYDITEYPLIIQGIREANMAHPFDAHSGTNAQQVGGSREPFDRGIAQAVSTESGAHYLVESWLQYTFYDGYSDAAHPTPAWPSSALIRIGWDPTGQTSDPNAATIQWTPNLVDSVLQETDMWWYAPATFQATGSEASVWIRASQDNALPSVRVGMDDITVKKILSEVPTPTPGPSGNAGISVY